MFLKNYWYVAAWGHEIDQKPLGRIILNKPVVFYRGQDGAAVALEDRCPHRRLALSMGKLVEGGLLQCHYHGLRFDQTGRCVRVPGQDLIPPSARVRSYPVVERYRWVWIWMGDPALADPEKIPDFHWLQDPEWGAKGTVFQVKANWQLIVDNLLDLTHLAFVHESTIGNAAVAEHADVRVQRSPTGVLVSRWMIDKPAPPTYVKAGGFTSNVDRWQFIDFTPPAFLRLHVGATPTGTGAPEGRFEGGIHMRNLNAITPETETTTHYFWAQAHDFDVGNQKTTDMVFEQVKIAFLEDLEVFEAQQRTIDLNPDAPQVDINADAGGIQARRIIARLAREEAATVSAAAAE
jgi:phenylpropionate dioxygenase-like ring-hydroxylating dioxygenase large terminal subunit